MCQHGHRTHSVYVRACIYVALPVLPTWQDGESLLELAADLRRAQRAAIGLHDVIWKKRTNRKMLSPEPELVSVTLAVAVKNSHELSSV